MIRIISGIIGAGKTLLAMYYMFLETSVKGYENYLKSCNLIKKLNDEGFNFSYPKEKHVTYFNSYARIAPMCRPVKHVYSFNPWLMGLPVPGKDVSIFFPGSKIFIDEAQRFYNSRMSYYFPDHVSRFFELSRQWDLDITLIVQRAKLVDLNIRDIAQELIFVEDLNLVVDDLGQMRSATWKIRKFSSCQELDHYLDGHNELGKEEIVECNENLFKMYDTKFFRFLFLYEKEGQDFVQSTLYPFRYSPEICNVLSEVYKSSPPPGYYDKFTGQKDEN